MSTETHRFENYTPHAVTIKSITFPSVGVARVEEEQLVVGNVEGFEIRQTIYKEIVGLPPQSSAGEVHYIVSMVVAQANARSREPRTDLLSPDTGKSCLRDAKGAIVAVTGFLEWC
jgi:hypothetical protein